MTMTEGEAEVLTQLAAAYLDNGRPKTRQELESTGATLLFEHVGGKSLHVPVLKTGNGHIQLRRRRTPPGEPVMYEVVGSTCPNCGQGKPVHRRACFDCLDAEDRRAEQDYTEDMATRHAALGGMA